MLNALRYGFATFLSFSKPLTFFLLAALTTYIVVEVTQIITSTFGQIPDSTLEPLGIFGAQLMVMNVMVMFFLSVPVAGQFAQEYRFTTLSNTFLIAPQRISVFVSKTVFALLYVFAAIAIIWVSFRFTATPLPLPLTGSGTLSPLVSTDLEFTWQMISVDDRWKVLLYITGYMLIVISLAIVTRSQTLGVLLPMFYLLFIEPGLMFASGYFAVMQLTWLKFIDFFRIFTHGQAWVNGEPFFPYGGIVYFGVTAMMVLWSLVLFVRRDSNIRD